jgi:L-fuconolactonase
MPVIDCHQHFWVFGKRKHTFPPPVGNRLDRSFTPDDLRPELKQAGVDATIIVQSLNDLGETEEFLGLQKSVDYVAGVVGWVPLADPKACAAALEQLPAHGKLVGIRHLMNYEPDPEWLLQPTVRESLGLLAKANMVFEAIPVSDAQFESVLTVARETPSLKIVLNHMGNPPVPDKGWEPWATQIARAAELRNVSVKLSAGLALVMKWKWSTDEVRRYADHTLGLFSPDRVMAGSNWPVVVLGGSFTEVWQGLTDLLNGLTPTERAAVLGGTATRIYGL